MQNQVFFEQQIVQENRAYMITMYLCFFLGLTLMPGLATIVGLVMAYAKRKAVWGTFYFDHCRWLIRTFWISFILGLLTYCVTFFVAFIPFFGVFLLPVFYIIIVLIPLWYLVRLIYGFIKLLDNQKVNPLTYWF